MNELPGLYLIAASQFGDSASLFLPYSLGENDQILAADGSTIARSGNANLYNHGHCPFLPDHPTQLCVILMQWWEKVENDEWQIGEYGIEENIDIWREADSEEGAEAYKPDFVCI